MIETTIKKVDTLAVEAVVCDRCKKRYHNHDSDCHDEIQEFVHINAVGGYGSVFGDGHHIQCELCQTCVKELLGPYLRISAQVEGSVAQRTLPIPTDVLRR